MTRRAPRVAIVTGAGRGLGRAYALALAADGVAVVVNDPGTDLHGRGLESGPARTVVQEIRAGGGEAVASHAAVGTIAAGEALVRCALDEFGRVDVLVNNAGITTSAPVDMLSMEDWERVLAVHLTGTFACIRAAFGTMRAAGRGGRIVTTTSGAAFRAYPGTAAYAAAKGGVASLTRVVAAEGAPFGITCNAVAPLARTRMSSAFLAGDDATELDPAAVAPLIVYLASEASGDVTGQVFRIARARIGVVRADADDGVAAATGRWTADEIRRRIREIVGPGA
jgi:NAD(P)-dependent dehydrogenase (short-subunit alcohol dehydrogenase family)